MRFFAIDPLGNINDDRTLAVAEGPPADLESPESPAFGDAVSSDWPADAKIYMSPEFKGVRVSSFISNPVLYLMVTSETKDIIERHCQSIEVEFLPFSLYNQKRRLQTRDCWIVNPLGEFDCLNRSKSELVLSKKGTIINIKRAVLDTNKIEAAPQLFRIKGRASVYVLGEKLVDDLRRHKCTNLALTELEIG